MGLVFLLGGASVSCKNDGSTLVDEYVALYARLGQFYCECAVAAQGGAPSECSSEGYYGLNPEYESCLEGVIERSPTASETFECELAIAKSYVDCLIAVGCDEDLPDFVCDDGIEFPGDYQCDGDLDCAGGEDEAECESATGSVACEYQYTVGVDACPQFSEADEDAFDACVPDDYYY